MREQYPFRRRFAPLPFRPGWPYCSDSALRNMVPSRSQSFGASQAKRSPRRHGVQRSRSSFTMIETNSGNLVAAFQRGTSAALVASPTRS